MKFHKYQGTGNDFVVIDNRNQVIDLQDYKLIRELCDRHFGIGSDGLIVLQEHPIYDFEMFYYNADGQPGTMCGNGGRCAAHFASFLQICGKRCNFAFQNSVHEAIVTDSSVKLKMQNVSGLKNYNSDYSAIFMDTGSPHYVKLESNLETFPVAEVGRQIRQQERFADLGGVNVNFVELGNTVIMRTFERGVEAETLSCGTGAVAVAITCTMHGLKSPIQIETRGGLLTIHLKKTAQTYHDIYLEGPVKHVFWGEYEH